MDISSRLRTYRKIILSGVLVFASFSAFSQNSNLLDLKDILPPYMLKPEYYGIDSTQSPRILTSFLSAGMLNNYLRQSTYSNGPYAFLKSQNNLYWKSLKIKWNATYLRSFSNKYNDQLLQYVKVGFDAYAKQYKKASVNSNGNKILRGYYSFVWTNDLVIDSFRRSYIGADIELYQPSSNLETFGGWNIMYSPKANRWYFSLYWNYLIPLYRLSVPRSYLNKLYVSTEVSRVRRNGKGVWGPHKFYGILEVFGRGGNSVQVFYSYSPWHIEHIRNHEYGIMLNIPVITRIRPRRVSSD